MDRLKTILAALDFSECSLSALAQAARMARWNQARLHLLHTVDGVVYSDAALASNIPYEQLLKQTVTEAQCAMERSLQAAGGAKDFRILVETGYPIDSVLRQVRASQADLLVLGVTGSSQIPMGAGTLATKCLRKAPTKVMLVHEGHTGPFQRIIAGVDFSDRSREAVTQALRVARQDHARVHVVHVFTGSWGRFPLMSDSWDVPEELAAEYRRGIEARLRDFVGDTGGCDVHFAVVEASTHGHGLAEYARRVRADLVVLGTKGRSDLGYVLLGSTVERLLRELPCSALVVRPPAEIMESRAAEAV